MADESGSVIKRAARSATAPVRGYINNHFEMVKEEVRNAGAAGGGGDPTAWDRLSELESMLAEQSIHQARVLARLGDDVSELTARIADLERVVRDLAVAVAPPSPSP